MPATDAPNTLRMPISLMRFCGQAGKIANNPIIEISMLTNAANETIFSIGYPARNVASANLPC